MRTVYQIRIKLADITPTIWRRILISSDSTLYDLHQAIQCAMSWQEKHDYFFEYGGVSYSTNAKEINLLTQLRLSPQCRLLYLYDTDNHWEHDVLIEEIWPASRHEQYPCCIAGARAAPPDATAGVCGYETMLETLDEGDGEAYQELIEQISEDFDPDAFDLGVVNQRLACLHKAALATT